MIWNLNLSTFVTKIHSKHSAFQANNYPNRSSCQVTGTSQVPQLVSMLSRKQNNKISLHRKVNPCLLFFSFLLFWKYYLLFIWCLSTAHKVVFQLITHLNFVFSGLKSSQGLIHQLSIWWVVAGMWGGSILAQRIHLCQQSAMYIYCGRKSGPHNADTFCRQVDKA